MIKLKLSHKSLNLCIRTKTIIPMKITKFIILLLFLPCILFGKVNFFEGSLNEAQRTAALEGKLYFIDFYASYCLPCKLMDQTTFMDADLGDYIKENYVPLKLNIDAFDAYEVRNKHEVDVLPTVMIFSSAGELLESYSGSMTASKLRSMLEKYNIPQHRQKTNPPAPETAYIDIVEKPKRKITLTPGPTSRPLRTSVRKETLKPRSDEKPTTNPIRISEVTFEKDKKTTSTLTSTPKKKVNQKYGLTKPKLPKPTTIVQIPPKPAQEKQKTKGLYEFSAKVHPSKGFAIQIGVFAEYSSVLIEVEKIQRSFPKRKVIVHIDEINEKTVYRIAIGTFSTSTTARKFIGEVKAEGFQCFVKDLSTLK